jgi:mono/diheme cytochrome c family protein
MSAQLCLPWGCGGRPIALALLLGAAACRRQEPPPAADAGAAPSGDVQPPVREDEAPPLFPHELAAGRQAVNNDCLACHTEELLSQQRLTEGQWAKVVTKMRGWGSLLPEEDEARLVTYLAKRYGPRSPPFEPEKIDPPAALAAVEPKPEARFDGGNHTRGAEIYRQMCRTCHGAQGQGGLGTALADRPLLYRPTSFAEQVRTGRGKMPAYPQLTDADIAALLAYLRPLRPSS